MQEKTRKMLPPDELNDILGDHRRWLESYQNICKKRICENALSTDV